MTINELVSSTQQNAKAIKREHKVIVNFQQQNPWIIENVLNDMKMHGELENAHSLAPSFDSILTFKEEYFVNSMSKIYRQVSKRVGESCPVYFYKIIPEFFEEQCQKGYQLGDIDDLGYVVTGSNLVIETNVIQKDEFLTHYYSNHN